MSVARKSARLHCSWRPQARILQHGEDRDHQRLCDHEGVAEHGRCNDAADEKAEAADCPRRVCSDDRPDRCAADLRTDRDEAYEGDIGYEDEPGFAGERARQPKEALEHTGSRDHQEAGGAAGDHIAPEHVTQEIRVACDGHDKSPVLQLTMRAHLRAAAHEVDYLPGNGMCGRSWAIVAPWQRSGRSEITCANGASAAA